MENHASHDLPTRSRVYPERRVGQDDRRSSFLPASAREEPSTARTDVNSKAGGQAKARPPLSDDRSWGVQEVAYFLNVSESTIRNLERDGELPALPRIGTRIIFDPKVVRAFRDGWRPPPRGRALGRPGISVRSDPRALR